MENVVLVIHLIIALFLIAVVLLQRSEGGALGIGGGGGGLVSARGAATALSKVTWMLAIGFLCTSILLTIMSGGGSQTGSILDQPINTDAPLTEQLGTPAQGGSDEDVPLPSAPASN